MYYSKTELLNVLKDLVKSAADRNANFLVKPDDVLKELADERDAVSIAWNEKKMLSETKEGIDLKIYTFIKVAGFVWTDDQYAIDQYASVMQKKDLADVIKMNMFLKKQNK